MFLHLVMCGLEYQLRLAFVYGPSSIDEWFERVLQQRYVGMRRQMLPSPILSSEPREKTSVHHLKQQRMMQVEGMVVAAEAETAQLRRQARAAQFAAVQVGVFSPVYVTSALSSHTNSVCAG